MALAQAQFEKFHDTIKLGYENNLGLREKRNQLIEELKKSLPDDSPDWVWFNHGSYHLNTGIMPYNYNFDIDLGLNFYCSPSEYADPVELKIIVKNALAKKNRVLQIRNSCVTVIYMKNDRPEYHVDLSIYSNDYQRLYLATGRENSTQDSRNWVLSKPIKLSDYIKGCHKNENGLQFQRVVRYLKRWRDEKLASSNLPSIALTVAVAEWMEPNFDKHRNNPRDIYTLRDLVQRLLNQFRDSRLIINSPTIPYNDLLGSVTDDQMAELKDRLQTLVIALQDAIDEPDIYEACCLIRGQLGRDFPVPEKSYVPSPSNLIPKLIQAPQ